MNKNVTVKKEEDVTTISIKPFNMFIKFDKENLQITVDGGDNNEILLKGNTKMLVDGDFYLASTGEMGLMTNGQNLSLDSVNAQIHFNSRNSKLLKDAEETILYKAKLLEETNKRQITNIQENYQITDIIGDLLKRVNNIERLQKNPSC